MTCGIIGDSIALGLALASPKCDHVAKVGLSSKAITSLLLPGCYDKVVISAGSNDPTNILLHNNLVKIRKGVCSKSYIWIQPVNRRAKEVIRSLGVSFGDTTVSFVPGRDNVHPKSYTALKAKVFR